MIIITNNPLIKNMDYVNGEILYYDVNIMDILILARDRVHQGHKLISHPLFSSVKPNENPYKTIIISKDKGKLDINGLKVIENSISVASKFLKNSEIKHYSDEILEDFKFIDYTIISEKF